MKLQLQCHDSEENYLYALIVLLVAVKLMSLENDESLNFPVVYIYFINCNYVDLSLQQYLIHMFNFNSIVNCQCKT